MFLWNYVRNNGNIEIGKRQLMLKKLNKIKNEQQNNGVKNGDVRSLIRLSKLIIYIISFL